MPRLTDRERKIGRLTLLVILATVVYLYIIGPQLSRYAALQAEVEDLRLSLTQMQSNMQIKDRIESQYEGVRSLVHESASPSQEMSRFARLLSDLYSPLNMQTTSVRPLPDQQESHFRRFTLRLEMAGAVTEVARFLSSLSQVPEPIRVEWLELTCKDRPDYLAASLVVSKVVITPTGSAKAAPPSAHARQQPDLVVGDRR